MRLSALYQARRGAGRRVDLYLVVVLGQSRVRLP